MSLLDTDHYRGQYEAEMESLRQQVVQGNRQALFKAIEFYFRGVTMGITGPCPDWLAGAAVIPFNEFAEGQHEHMEHAFGMQLKPMKAPTRANRRRDRLVWEAVQLLEETRRAKPRFSRRKNETQDDSFEKVGKAFKKSVKSVELSYARYSARMARGEYDRAHELNALFLRRYAR
jgi:hypothetical protein